MADVMTSTASDCILVKERDLACDPDAGDLSVGKECKERSEGAVENLKTAKAPERLGVSRGRRRCWNWSLL